MKAKLNLFLFSLFLSLFFLPNFTHAVVHPTPENLSPKIENFTGSTALSLDDIVNLNAKELGKKRGKKLKLKERIAFFIMKKEIKRARKKGKSDTEIIQELGTPEEDAKNIIAYLLGLFFSLIGVLLVFLIFRKSTKYAWYGFLTYLAILALILFYTVYNGG
jgi:hypothetical protein